MPNSYITKTNFTSGEWTGELAGRVDLPQYGNAVKQMRNWVLVPRGGAKVRDGSVFAARTKFNNLATKVLPFEFNVEQTYIVEAGDLYMRFFAANTRLEDPTKNVTAVNNVGGANPVQISVTGHGYSNGNSVSLRNLGGAWQLNRDWTVTGVTANTFLLVGAAVPAAYTSGGTASKIVEIASIYPYSSVFDIHITQTEDTAYLFHNAHPTQKLTRTGATTFTLTEVDWVITPFIADNVTAITIDPNGTTEGSSVTAVASAALWTVDDVGRYYRVANGVIKVTSFNTSTSVGAIIKKTCVDAATANWAAGAWCETLGYPGSGTFYDNRLTVGSTLDAPQTFWSSKTGEYENFDMSATTDEFAYEFRVASKKANFIRWIASDDTLFIGTSGDEFRAYGGNESGITPTNIQVTRQAPHGCFATAPVETSSGVVFVQRGDEISGGKKLRLLTFNVDRNKYIASDLSVLSNEITGNGLLEISYQDEPNEIVWGVRNDGLMTSLTLLTEQNIIAWALHNTQGFYLSTESVTTATGSQSWQVVSRLVNSVLEQYIEYFEPDLALDCVVQTTFGAPVTSITGGLLHLEGMTVKVKGDGAMYPDQVVTNGALPAVLDPEATTVQVGLSYTPTLELFPPTREFPDGRTEGRELRTVKVTLRVKDSVGLTVGGQQNYTRSSADLTDAAPVPETADLEFTPDLGWNQNVLITQHLPYPSMIVAAFQYVEFGDT